MLVALSLGLPILDVFIEFLFLSFLAYLVLSNSPNGALQLRDFLILKRVVRILFVQLLYQLSQVLLLLLDIDVVALQVLIFLFGKHAIEFLVKVFNL